MRVESWTAGRGALAAGVIGLGGTAACLSLLVAALALRPRAVTVAWPGRGSADVLPDIVPDAAALSAASIYIYELENYTPATVERSSAHVKRRVAPRAWSAMSEALDRRSRVVQEGRMAAQVALDEPAVVRREPDGTLEVAFEGRRRLYIADRLSREHRVRHTVRLEASAPTSENPLGLAIVAHRSEEVADEPGR